MHWQCFPLNRKKVVLLRSKITDNTIVCTIVPTQENSTIEPIRLCYAIFSPIKNHFDGNFLSQRVYSGVSITKVTLLLILAVNLENTLGAPLSRAKMYVYGNNIDQYRYINRINRYSIQGSIVF